MFASSSLTDMSHDKLARIERLLSHYRRMLLIRRIEEESARAYAQGKIGGFLHLYIGQEAVGVGACAALEPSDYVVGTYRDHGIALAKGMSARQVMAELFGKATGCSKGLGGSMHLFDREHNMLGGYGIVGGHIPLAAGVAFASKYRGDERVTLCFFGEGAVSIGGFHEALSLAALWKLPVVFICENNEYSMGTPLSRTMSVEDVSLKAVAYGIARDRFFVNDVLEFEEHVARGRGSRADDGRADARRGAHLPLPWPLDERSRQVPECAGARRAQEERSGHASTPRARGRRPDATACRGGSVRRARGRGRGSLRRREP